MRDLPPDDAQWTQRAADWLMDHVSCVIKVLNHSPLTVDVLTADGATSLVDQMADIMDLWDRSVNSFVITLSDLYHYNTTKVHRLTWRQKLAKG